MPSYQIPANSVYAWYEHFKILIFIVLCQSMCTDSDSFNILYAAAAAYKHLNSNQLHLVFTVIHIYIYSQFSSFVPTMSWKKMLMIVCLNCDAVYGIVLAIVSSSSIYKIFVVC